MERYLRRKNEGRETARCRPTDCQRLGRGAGATIGSLLMAGCVLMGTSATPAAASPPISARVLSIVPGPIQPASGQPPISNRTDKVTIRVDVKPTVPVSCTVLLEYRGKIFGDGTVGGLVPSGTVAVSVVAYSRSRTTQGVKGVVRCAQAPKQGAGNESRSTVLQRKGHESSSTDCGCNRAPWPGVRDTPGALTGSRRKRPLRPVHSPVGRNRCYAMTE